MEDVLALYHEPNDETRPFICFDEFSKVLGGHERDPLPAEPGAVDRVDHRYARGQWLRSLLEGGASASYSVKNFI